jgi:hypothetical protein
MRVVQYLRHVDTPTGMNLKENNLRRQTRCVLSPRSRSHAPASPIRAATMCADGAQRHTPMAEVVIALRQ